MREFAKNVVRSIKSNLLSYISAVIIILLGVSVYIGFTLYTINMSRSFDSYFASAGYADVFASVGGISDSEVERLADIPGIDDASGRLCTTARLLTDKNDNIITLYLMGTDDFSERINMLLPEDGCNLSKDGIMIDLAMEGIYNFEKGDTLDILCRGQKIPLRYDGYVRTPEYITFVPDDTIMAGDSSIYAVACVDRALLEKLTGMTGNVNELGLKLTEGYTYEMVEDALKQALSQYGLFAVLPRIKQGSYIEIYDEIDQYEALSTGLSLIFLLVSAFMVYIIIRKMVDQDRVVIGTMKAMGASDRELISMYLMQGALIALPGALLAVGAGYGIATALFEDSMSYYHINSMGFVMYPGPVVTGILIALVMVIFSTLLGVWDVLKIMPSDAMRAAAPKVGRTLDLPRWLTRCLNQQQEIALRGIFRNPFRSFTVAFVIAVSIALFAVTNSMVPVVRILSAGEFDLIKTYDLRVVFDERVSENEAMDSLQNEHILRKEPFASYPMEVAAKNGSGYYSLTAMRDDSELYNIYDNTFRQHQLPEDGIMMSQQLAEKLKVSLGEEISLRSTDDPKAIAKIPVTRIITESYSMNMYLRLDLMERYFHRDLGVGSVLISVEDGFKQDVIDAMKMAGNLAYVVDTDILYVAYTAMVEQIFVMMNVIVVFAVLTGIATIYSIVSISIRERKMEFGTYIVLGTRPGEVFEMIGFEQLLCYIIGAVLSLPVSKLLAKFYEGAIKSDMIRSVVTISPEYYAAALAISAATVFVSILLVNHSIGQIELTDVLKERS